ncbi:TetR/AcrR family transcriptional regulator [Kerstersia gyiorum]|jgi:AcrR family transcriptional regulator|nr:TetR/AcrR family transcriptional regulator [Kerstersia gyiorum]MCH4271178.1 TetR/AcrR family transcriptional regulator [Kerstersia gyiorum]MCP1632768.1 AcrR family transcriptional regulator [Kerstersia gyiorum]MCP1635701.1 AcrR family transcriptional regulator [Kerstersia gyiorum]MCP1670892.1 AcrR family transcriptional regulator [Kerstersia gyiorum]MCP1678454.1 AcrR family transcriptional regulator [Kerstersia gyiorum]
MFVLVFRRAMTSTISSPVSLTLFPELGSRHVATLRAALRLFTEKGYFSTSIHDIGSAANVSVGFMYHHFSDKQGLAHALYQHLITSMNALLDDIEATHATARERCQAVVRMLFELTETEPDVMSFVVHARHQEFLPGEPSICSAMPFVRMRNFVFQGIEAGEIRTMEPIVAASMMYGAAIRMVCLRLDGVIAEPLARYIDELWHNTWQSLMT